MSKFIVVSAGNIWALAEDVDGSGVSYGTLDLRDYVTLKSIAEALNAKSENAVEESAAAVDPATLTIEARINRLAGAGLDVDAIRVEVEAYEQYKNSDGDYHFDYYEGLDTGDIISVCESFNSVERFLARIEEEAEDGGVL